MLRRLLPLAGLASALLTACPTDPPPSSSTTTTTTAVPSTPPAAPPTPAVTPTAAEHMKEHFAKAAEMQKAVIAGDLAGLKTAAAWMAEHELTAQMPEAWKVGVTSMQNAAHAARDAADVTAAAAAIGQLGVACAECHQKLGLPREKLGAPPAEASGTALHMQRHQWAVDTMWFGLMAPSDDVWVKGAEAMATAPLNAHEIEPEKTVTKELADLATGAHAIAQRAVGVERDQRAKVYAELLVTCTACHQQAKK